MREEDDAKHEEGMKVWNTQLWGDEKDRNDLERNRKVPFAEYFQLANGGCEKRGNDGSMGIFQHSLPLRPRVCSVIHLHPHCMKQCAVLFVRLF
jgi:hypothetical protein